MHPAGHATRYPSALWQAWLTVNLEVACSAVRQPLYSFTMLYGHTNVGHGFVKQEWDMIVLTHVSVHARKQLGFTALHVFCISHT